MDEVKCPTCEGQGLIPMDEAIELRGDSPKFMSDQEYLDDLIHAAGGESIYPRCPQNGHRCTYASERFDVAEIRDRNERYKAAGLGDGWMCCRGVVNE